MDLVHCSESLFHPNTNSILLLSYQRSTSPRSSLYFSEGNINNYFPMWLSPGLKQLGSVILQCWIWKPFICNAPSSDVRSQCEFLNAAILEIVLLIISVVIVYGL